jgi:hypothetical protein
MLEDQVIQIAVADIFDARIPIMADTSISFDFDQILWSTFDTCQRPADLVETKLDKNEQVQKPLQREQPDSANLRSVSITQSKLPVFSQ